IVPRAARPWAQYRPRQVDREQEEDNMKTWIRRSLIGVASLVGIAAVAVLVAAHMGDRKRERHIELAVAPIAYRSDAQSVERGGYLFRSRGCGECHGADGAGKTVIDDGNGMLVRSPDITPAGVVAAYEPRDWVRSIRHGVKPDGRPIFIMPSEDFNRLTDADVASIVAFTRQLPRQRGDHAVIELPLPVRVLYAVGVVRDAAEKIDHDLPVAQPITEDVSAAHGALS